MRVYLDNCCYHRPFDPQGDLRIVLETLAKMRIQSLMRSGTLEYVWSDILVHEVLRNPFLGRREAILEWMDHASTYVEMTDDVLARGIAILGYGIKPKDALHLASAEKAMCDWFLTTDKGILKKLKCIGGTRIANPVEFMVHGGGDDDEECTV